MAARITERRQHKRAGVDVKVVVRPREGDSAAAITGRARNVSLAGVYAILPSPAAFEPGAQVMCTVTVPPEETKRFPFVRLLGNGWVVRTTPYEPAAGEETGGSPEVGVAVAFTGDVTALGTVGGYR